jgi:hypothetical protein
MFPPFACCSAGTDSRQTYQQHKLALLRHWRDSLERQLAAANAAIGTMEQQIRRDAAPESIP